MPEISAVICNRIGDRRQDGLGCIAMHACIYTTLNNVLCVSVCVCVCACEWAEGDPGRCSQVRRMAGLWYSMASVASRRMSAAAAGDPHPGHICPGTCHRRAQRRRAPAISARRLPPAAQTPPERVNAAPRTCGTNTASPAAARPKRVPTGRGLLQCSADHKASSGLRTGRRASRRRNRPARADDWDGATSWKRIRQKSGAPLPHYMQA